MDPSTAALVTSDYGRPDPGAAGRAHAVAGKKYVFAREYEKAVVTLDCNNWKASFTLKVDRPLGAVRSTGRRQLFD